MRAERVGAETMLAQIVRMVSEARRTRAPIQRLADLVSSYFVPGVILVAVITFVAWSYFGPEPRMAHALVNAVAVLIIACPVPLGLATPMSIMVGTGRGAPPVYWSRTPRRSRRWSGSIRSLSTRPARSPRESRGVVSVVPAPGQDESELLALAASLEQASEHPLAAAIVGAAREKGLKLACGRGFPVAHRTREPREQSKAGPSPSATSRFSRSSVFPRRPWAIGPTSCVATARRSSSSLVDGQPGGLARHRRSDQGLGGQRRQ